MAFLEIPVVSDPQAYEFEITLDGTPYRLAFYFNKRRGTWHMSVRTQNEEDIVVGLPIFVGYPVLDRFRDTRLPPGTFLPIDTGNGSLDPTQDDFGTRVKLLYIEEGTVVG